MFIEAVKHLTSFNVVKCLTASKNVLNDLYNKVGAMLLSLRNCLHVMYLDGPMSIKYALTLFGLSSSINTSMK